MTSENEENYGLALCCRNYRAIKSTNYAAGGTCLPFSPLMLMMMDISTKMSLGFIIDRFNMKHSCFVSPSGMAGPAVDHFI